MAERVGQGGDAAPTGLANAAFGAHAGCEGAAQCGSSASTTTSTCSGVQWRW